MLPIWQILSTYTIPLFSWMSNCIQFICASSITELCARKWNYHSIAWVETKYRSFWDMEHCGFNARVFFGLDVSTPPRSKHPFLCCDLRLSSCSIFRVNWTPTFFSHIFLLLVLLGLGSTVSACSAAIVTLTVHDFTVLNTIIPTQTRVVLDHCFDSLLKNLMDTASSCLRSRDGISVVLDERTFVGPHTDLDQLFLNWTRLSAPRSLHIIRCILPFSDDPIKVFRD